MKRKGDVGAAKVPGAIGFCLISARSLALRCCVSRWKTTPASTATGSARVTIALGPLFMWLTNNCLLLQLLTGHFFREREAPARVAD